MNDVPAFEVARFQSIVARSIELSRRVAVELPEAVLRVVALCEASLRGGGTLFFCGNGGSAADAQHLAAELVVRLRAHVERGSWPAVALTADAAALTACGNDYGFERVFERPLRGLGRRGDVLFGLSTSGRSLNVVQALRAAREMGIATVGLLGGEGEPALSCCDHPILVPDAQTARVQECHMIIGHAILEMLEDRLVNSGWRRAAATA